MRAPEFWDRPPGLLAALLSPASAAWATAGRLRAVAAQPYRAPVPVVCVGNLVVGGSGKTPVVIGLANWLRARSVSAHVVTRGYGGALAGPVPVDPQQHDAAAVGDEALLLAGYLPCWVSRERAAAVRAAASSGAELVLLDDGFQNPTVGKDLSLLVVDAGYGFGNGRVMPAGPLREPIAAGLARADAIVLIGPGEPPELRQSELPILRADLVPQNAEHCPGRRFVAFAGIGRPAKFFATLTGVGAELVSAHPFADHHVFTIAEIEGLRRRAARAGATLITTAKDWARLQRDWRDGIAVLDVALSWRDPAMLDRILRRVLPAVEPDADRRLAQRG